MTDHEPLVDIHCHLLPGVDDGAADWDEAAAMARLAAADGIGTVIVTPHQLGAHRNTDGRAIRERTAHLQQFLEQQGVDLRVLPGADVRIEADLIEKIRSGQVLTLADRGRYVLLELPHEVYLPLDGLLAGLRRAGMVGVLSHPERNAGILRQPGVVEGLVDAGCLMQVTAGSLLGAFGVDAQRLAERLVVGGLVHFLATDAHGSKARRPLMRQAMDRVAKLVDCQLARDLCCRNPAAVVADQHVAPGRRPAKRAGLSRWLAWGRSR